MGQVDTAIHRKYCKDSKSLPFKIADNNQQHENLSIQNLYPFNLIQFSLVMNYHNPNPNPALYNPNPNPNPNPKPVP